MTKRRLAAVACAALSLMGCSAAVGSTPDDVVTPATLGPRLADARGGQTLRLQPGDYGTVKVPRRSFDPALVLEADGAVFSALDLTGVSGITLRKGRIIGPGGRSYGIKIYGAQRVRIEGMVISGSHRGIVVGADSRDVELVGNELTGLISDGIDISLSRNILVERNRCRAFTPRPATYDAAGKLIRDGDHPDCIQAWSRPSHPPTADLRIIDNDIEGEMQGIFLGNHVRNGVDDGGFDRIVVRGNRIRIGRHNGIVLGNARDSEVVGNTVESLPGLRPVRNRMARIKANLRVSGERNQVCGNRVPDVPQPRFTAPCPDRNPITREGSR